MSRVVLILDPAKTSRDKGAAVVAALGYTPVVAADAFEAHALVDGVGAVVAVHPTAEALYPRLRADGTPLILSLSPRQPRPAALSAHLQADAFVLRPYRRDTLDIALYAASQAGLLRDRANRAELALAEVSGVRRDRNGSGLLHLDLFKTLLPMEIRRARRHGYPMALCVVQLDPLPGSKQPQTEIVTACEPLIKRAVRDVDLAVRYGDGRFLVLLPHTDRRGAESVGARIVDHIRAYRFRASGVTRMVTASVGIATQRVETPSFARMVKDAHQALKAAELKGGDRAIVR